MSTPLPSTTADTAGFRLSVQQASAWRLAERTGLGARALFAAPAGCTPGDLRSALTAVAHRHEILRSRVRTVAGVPLQFIDEEAAPAWQVVTVDGVDALFDTPLPGDAGLMAAWVEAGSSSDPAVFLAVGPLHGDAATLELVAAELREIFGGSAPSTDPVQYADYAQWQQERIDEDPQGRAFWLRQGLHAVARLPLARPAQGGFQPARRPVLDDCDLPEESVLGAWALLLARHAGQEQLPLGLVDAGRQEELADACGPYARVLPMALPQPALPSSSWDSWCDAIAAARGQVLSQRDTHADATAQLPLQYCLAAATSALREQAVEAPFRLRLDVRPAPAAGRLRLQLAYDRSRFDDAAVEELAAQLRALLSSAGDKTRPLNELRWLHPAAQRLVDAGLTRHTEATLAQPPLLHELVSASALAQPARTAVVCGDEALSHAELDAAADRLAARLVAAGAGPDGVVGVCLERSTGLLVGLLGVLKAGAAYLPLDPAYPPERLAYMLRDSGASCVLVHAATRGRAPTGLPLVELDADAPAAPGAEAPPPRRPHPDQLAYLIYTSGSTGRPKGVAVTHRNAVHSTLARERWYERRVASYLLLSSVAFDSSVAGIFWTLAQGGTLVLPREEQHRDPPALARLVERHRVSHLLALPSLHAQLLDEAPRLATLTDVVVAGETCPAALVDAHHAALPGCALFNEYGPTEASVWSVAHRTRPGEDPVPIGQAIPFIRAHVLDDGLQPVPPGLDGELYLAGPALARGYLGRPDLTAERFVPHPQALRAGERLYRTGDRVRWWPDGRIDFLGRKDQQVKIRGFRIELGEIEARLLSHAGVREAAALVREDRPGERRLVAYVLPRGDAPSAESLRQHLARALPEHQLPSAIVVLAAFPQTPNGKLDRQALPAPEAATRSAYLAPRNASESLIAAIWCDVLGTDRVGVHDNFFELGGHSLVATQVITRMRRSFGIELPVHELFSAPTVAGLAQAVQRQRPAATPQAPIEAAPRDGELPLSFAQQRLWFLAQLDPQDVSYHIPGVVRLDGPLDGEALSIAFQALLRRHELLRTRFPADAQGRPRQVIDAEPTARLARAEAADEAAAEAFALEEAMRPFSLADGPLLRFTLLRLAPQRHQLVVVMHHVISDGWSTERLLQELGALYAQALEGLPPALPPPGLQYADYALWQRRHLTEAVLDAELAHWRRVLGDEQPLLALPADHPRPALLSGRGGHVHLRLPEALSRQAVLFARSHNASLFMLLEAVFAALLSRHAGQADVRVGTPVAARQRLELEALPGLFVNTVVLRHDLRRAPGLAELLAATRQAVLDAGEHAELPFERLVDALAPERDLSHPPLFQAMFDMQTERYAALDAWPGLRGGLAAIDTPTAKFDLSLSVSEKDGLIHGNFEYSTDLFERATVERFAQHYAVLLQAALDEPLRPLADLPLLTPAEAASQPAAPVRAMPLAQGFASLFLDTVRRHPQRIAVDDGQAMLSYTELADRARVLAARLQAAGSTRDTPVAVLLPRSNDYLVAIVACLLAGAAYLPLDPALPEARIAQMIEGARPAVLVGTPASAGRWAGRLAIVAPTVAPGGAPAGWRPPATHAEQLAYVIYTSGSTGTPKGAMVTQAGMLNNLLGKVDQLGLTPDDRVAQTASPCFDISVWQFLTPLLCGASVHIVPDTLARDAAALLETVRARGITVLESVPSLIRGMLDDPDAADELPTLRWLLPTGEAMPPTLAARWLQRHAAVPLLNAYGPAECADDVALWHIDQPPPPGLAHLPIGRAAANLRLHVVNEALQPQPAGVAGELAIGGVGVGRGYLGDPALTAERFVPDPFGPPGARLYRSGDLVRCDTDGVLSFLGRRDHQVKIRGHRVELGEIEARLAQHAAVRAAAVLARGEPARLVAYVVGRAEELGRETLLAHLAAVLPDYMLPAAFVPLDGLPLNANGKLDRSRLPEPDFGAPAPVASRPLDATEQALAEIWAQALGVPAVGLHDNFFALGGDSIVSIQVVSRARQAGLKISARALFQHPTLQALAAVAQTAPTEAERAAPTGLLPLTPMQHAFFDQPWPHARALHHWNQSLLLTPAARLDGELVRATLAALVAHHDSLRLRFSARHGGWTQHYAGTETAELLHTQSLQRPQRELMPACDLLQASLDIEHGPLLRAGLFELPDGSQRLLLAMHHLVVDGVSCRILLEDFGSVYRRLAQGQPPKLPPRSASFQDWALHLQAPVTQERCDRERAYWLAQGAPAFAVEHPGGRNAEGDVDTLQVTLDSGTTARLLQSARLNARPDDFLLTALARVLLPWSGQPALLVEQEGHGRPDEPDVGRTVGWFTAAYPVRLSLPEDDTPAVQIKHVKEILRRVPHDGSGYGVLRHLQASLPPSGVQLSFNYLGQLDAGLDGEVFSAIGSRSGRLHHADAPRAVEFDLNSYVLDGRLHIDWSYSRERWRTGSVQALAQAYRDELAALLDGAAREGIDLLTPQDFPAVALDTATLEQLLEGME